MVRREIESMDKGIDRIVYELPPTGMVYGLSADEIRIMERYIQKMTVIRPECLSYN